MADSSIKTKKAQSTLEAAIVFVTVVLFLLGSFVVWKKANQDIVKQVDSFKESRQSRAQ
jgi:hypothetical protein